MQRHRPYTAPSSRIRYPLRMTERTETEAIEARIAELKLEHRDLDDVILRLMQTQVVDQLQLQRLKKRKLLVKDQISMLERQLTPDIPA